MKHVKKIRKKLYELKNLEGIEFVHGCDKRKTTLQNGLMSIFWTQKVKLFYAALLANNSHCSGVM